MHLAHGYVRTWATHRSRFAAKLCDWRIVRAPFPAMSLSKNASPSSQCAIPPTKTGYEPQSKHKKKKLAEAKLTEQYLLAIQPRRVPLQKVGCHQQNRGGLYDVANRDNEVQRAEDLVVIPFPFDRTGLHWLTELPAERPSRPKCNCQCKCQHRPGKGILCSGCWRYVGPGCCWRPDDQLCHECLEWVYPEPDPEPTTYYPLPSSKRPASRSSSPSLTPTEPYSPSTVIVTPEHRRPSPAIIIGVSLKIEAHCRQRFTICTKCESGPTGEVARCRAAEAAEAAEDEDAESGYTPYYESRNAEGTIRYRSKEDKESDECMLKRVAEERAASGSVIMSCESRGHVLLILGGGTTECVQTNDTLMHQSLRKEYERL